MRRSALKKLKKTERGNVALMRRANAANYEQSAEKRWFFENRLQLLRLTLDALSTLSEVKTLPAEGGETRIMKLCRKIVEDCSFKLTEEEIISRINAYQQSNAYLTVDELLYLRIYFHFVCVDIVADGIKDGTLFKTGDAVRLIFSIRDLDFERVYETVSYSESVLIRDPADVYVRCDGATKSMYRKKLSEISRRFRMGEYETSKFILKNAEESEGRARHVGWHIMKYSRHGAAAVLYFPTLFICPALIIAVLAGAACMTDRTTLLLSAVLLYIPLHVSAKAIFDRLLHDKTPDILPRLSLDTIPKEGKTLVVFTVSLSGKGGDRDVFDRLGTYAQAYRDENLGFAVLADLPDADTEEAPEDENIISEAKERIDEIKKAGGQAYFFFRRREKSDTERRFIGAERKRGAQAELFSLLSGGSSSLEVYGGAPAEYKYVLALDADTEILFGDIKKLIATALHPYCAPFVSRGGGYPVVTDGYGVIAPVAKVSEKEAGRRRLYTALRYAYGGKSEYERAEFSVYSYLFGIGSFCGKGLISVDAYMKTIYGAFPHERILSHDTAEGVRLRCGFASDLRVYDGVPKDYLRERARAHRWIRGDAQAMCLLGRGVKSVTGEKYKNPVGLNGRLLMLEPVLSAAASVMRPPVIILSLIGGTPLGVLIFLLSVSDDIVNACALAIGSIGVPFRKYFSCIPNYYATAAFDTAFAASSKADTAALSADAIYRAFYRMRFSGRRLLEWKTAAASDRDAGGGAWRYIKTMWASMLVGAISVFAAASPGGPMRFILVLYGILWLAFPLYMWRLNNAPSCKDKPETEEKSGISGDVALMWRFFSDNVTAKSSFLPPDNVTLLPETKTAERTSPTNIGMYLVSAVNAYDFGIIASGELHRRLSETLGTLERLEKWHGHLYNWYDTKTLEVLYPAYVSTVDSGNLAASLLTVKNAVSSMDGFSDVTDAADALIRGADFSALYNKRRNLFYIGCNTVKGEPDKNVYDLFASESLTTSFFAVATGQVPDEHIAALSRVFSDERGREILLSWSGSAFEYFMPSIFLPSVPGTARHEALAAAEHFQRADRVTLDGAPLFGRSESSFYDFDDSVSYAYKAHGCDSLALSPEIKEENVIAPYSIYLISQFSSDAADILDMHRAGELYGKYGFYESVDMTPSRLGAEHGVVRQYMSHHVGMSIASAANVCFGGINVKRFCSEPCISASLPLIFESISLNRPRSEEKYTLRAKTRTPAIEKEHGGFIISDSAVVSNGREKIIADRDGSITVYDGQRLLTAPPCRGCSGFYVILRTGGEVFSCVSNPRTQFSADGTSISYVNEFIEKERIIRTELTMTVSPMSPSAVFELTASGISGHADVLILFSPVMNTRSAYTAAPSYSDLFIISETEDDGVVRFSRKLSPGVASELFVKVSRKETDTLVIHTKKDAVLPFGYSYDDIVSILDAPATENEGACVRPVFAAVIGSDCEDGTLECGVSLGEEKTLLYTLSAADSKIGLEKLLRVNGALSGADSAAVRCAMELSGDICRNGVRIVNCREKMRLPGGRGVLWKHGISGDLPIVLVFCCELTSSADAFAVQELISAKRFLFVSGVRFDLVFAAPASGYLNGGTGQLRSLIKSSASERLLGKNNGIFVIDRESLTPEEELYFHVAACRVFDIGTSHAFGIIKPSAEKAAPGKTALRKEKISFKYNGSLPTIKNGRNAAPFSNVYANSVFGTLVNSISCGYSWYGNSALCRISGRHVDPLLGEPGEQVLLFAGGEAYDLCRSAETVVFGRGCAKYSGEVGGVEYELTVGVSAKLPAKLCHLTIKNKAELPADLADSLRARLLLYPEFSSLFSGGRLMPISEISIEAALFAAADEIYDNVECGDDCVFIQCALPDGCCGFIVSASPAESGSLRYIKDEFRRAELIPYAFEEYERHVNMLLLANAYRGDAPFLSGLPDTAAYQTVFFRILARSGHDQSGGAYGFRDQLQDSLAALFFRPELTKQQILRSCARQYENGRVQHWWHPYPFGGGLKTKCSDDYMWLPLTVAEYVLSTGDSDILSLRTPYLVSPPLSSDEGDRYERAAVGDYRATVLEHCILAVSSSYERGTHGLPLIGSGDWNDGMNEVGVKGRGESVWLAFFFAVVYRRFSEMLRAFAIDPILSERLMYEADALVSAAELTSWDGEWYVRAFDDDGKPLGSKDCAECKIDLLPQAFSVFAGTASERSEKAMSSVLSELYDEKTGILRLFAPSYDKVEKHGYICRYPAGIRENGGQYTHAAVWCAAAFFAAGKRETGTKLLSSLSPYRIYKDGCNGGRFSSEPYLMTADIYFGEGITGRSGWSGYTGSAAWFYMTVMRYYLGISLVSGCVVLTPTGDVSYSAAVRAGGCEVELTVSGEAEANGDWDETFSVSAGEAVTIKPRGSKMKIYVKVEN